MNEPLESIPNTLTPPVLDKEVVYQTLSEKERVEVDRFTDYGLKKGEKLVINEKTREVDRFDREEWVRMENSHEHTNWTIILEK